VRLALRQTHAQVVVFDQLTYAESLLNLQDVQSHPRCAFIKGDITDPRRSGTR
jgi:dTDP-D-glucose 4,6-dehydratase